MSLTRSYDSRHYQPRTYDIGNKPSYHGYSDEYWSRRSEGYSSSYSSRFSDRSDENPFSPYSDKYSYYSDKVVRKDHENLPLESTKYGINNNYEWNQEVKHPQGDHKVGSKDQEVIRYMSKETEEQSPGPKYGHHFDPRYDHGSDGNAKGSSGYPSEERYEMADHLMTMEDDNDVDGDDDVGRGPLSRQDEHTILNHNDHDLLFEKQQDEVFTDDTTDGIDGVEDKHALISIDGYTRFVSVIPEEKRYLSSVNYLPDRIELRLMAAAPLHKPPPKWRSIPDLYNITIRPMASVGEQIVPQETHMDYAFNDTDCTLHYHSPKHDHLKEMYVTQYTHHFDPEQPRSHIAGWKVDLEPNEVPHQKSRMCVLKSPVVSGSSKKRPSRPKSAPPKLIPFDSYEDDVFELQRVDVAESLSSFPRDDDLSSIGYDPSDETSESSALNYSPRNKSGKLGYNKPRLIKLSAEFPGVRNLDKMRRKKQSMGSTSSTRSLSSLPLSESRPISSTRSLPREEENYGFYLALTSPNVNQSDGRMAYSYSDH